MGKILHLTLKKKWFDMILSGEKKEEYREIKPYWINRFGYYYDSDRETGYYDHVFSKQFDIVCFKNGYAKDAPEMQIEIGDMSLAQGKPEWGAPEKCKTFIIHLGRILSTKNIK